MTRKPKKPLAKKTAEADGVVPLPYDISFSSYRKDYRANILAEKFKTSWLPDIYVSARAENNLDPEVGRKLDSLLSREFYANRNIEDGDTEVCFAIIAHDKVRINHQAPLVSRIMTSCGYDVMYIDIHTLCLLLDNNSVKPANLPDLKEINSHDYLIIDYMLSPEDLHFLPPHVFSALKSFILQYIHSGASIITVYDNIWAAKKTPDKENRSSSHDLVFGLVEDFFQVI